MQNVRFRSKDDVLEFEPYQCDDLESVQERDGSVSGTREAVKRSRVPSQTYMPLPIPPQASSMAYRLWAVALVLCATVPFLQNSSLLAKGSPVQGVDGGVVPEHVRTTTELSKRQESTTDVCFRWAQQCT